MNTASKSVSILKIAVSSLALVSMSAFANDKSNGCGLGWSLFKDTSLISSSLRSVTNQVLPNTFSMTSGTSNCARHSIVYTELRGLHFVEANADSLEVNIAAGEGQYLDGFADALGCQPSVMPQFASALQAEYTSLFANESGLQGAGADQTHGAASWELYSKLKNTLLSRGDIVQKCSVLAGQS